MPDIQPFMIPAGAVSPGGSAAVGIRVDGEVRALCIGSADNPRDAKACALRNVRQLLAKLVALDPEELLVEQLVIPMWMR